MSKNFDIVLCVLREKESIHRIMEFKDEKDHVCSELSNVDLNDLILSKIYVFVSQLLMLLKNERVHMIIHKWYIDNF